MQALQKAGREGASKEKMAKIRAQHDKLDEVQVDEARGYKIEPKESPVFKGSRANPMMRHFSVSVGNKEVGWLEHDKDDDTVRGSLHGKSVNISRHKGDTVADKFKSYINQMKEEVEQVDEAKYQGREVPLGKPMQGDVKKSKVYVKGPKGNVVKVNFGDKKMRIKKSNPGRRKNFRARHNCKNPGPRWKARYWSCRAW